MRKKSNSNGHSNNIISIDDDTKIKKNYNIKDIKPIKPITEKQRKFLENPYKNHLLYGSAGTGKSFLASYVGMCSVLNQNHEKMIIVRSIVPSRDIGYLPGDQEEKIEVYELPYHEIFAELFGPRSSYEYLKKLNFVEFVPTSFLRGTTFKDCFVLVDEFQNMNKAELNTIMTRIGENTQVVFAGDTKQNDLLYNRNDTSGADFLINIINKMPSYFSSIEFSIDDVVRSDLVKTYLGLLEI